MCFTDKRKRNWIRKEDRVPDYIRPLGPVESGKEAEAFTSWAYLEQFVSIRTFFWMNYRGYLCIGM